MISVWNIKWIVERESKPANLDFKYIYIHYILDEISTISNYFTDLLGYWNN